MYIGVLDGYADLLAEEFPALVEPLVHLSICAIYTCIYVYIYIYIYIYEDIHTYLYIHKYTCRWTSATSIYLCIYM